MKQHSYLRWLAHELPKTLLTAAVIAAFWSLLFIMGSMIIYGRVKW